MNEPKDTYSARIEEILQETVARIQNAIDEYDQRVRVNMNVAGGDPDFPGYAQRQERVILNLYGEYERVFIEAVAISTSLAYKQAIQLTLETIASDFPEAGQQVTYDSKAIFRLIDDATSDVRRATATTRAYMKDYFKISKQGVATESEISEAVANALIKDGTPTAVKKAVRDLLKSASTRPSTYTKFFTANDAEYRSYFISKFGKTKFEKLLKASKGFKDDLYIQIINKNGHPMRFKLNDYTDMVARHHITNAQVSATIEVGERNLRIRLFKVPGHNTTAKVCVPHENKIYTLEAKLVEWGVFEYLSPENRPGYHPRCSHRIIPYVMSYTKLYWMCREKAGKSAVDEFFSSRGLKIPGEVAA